MREAAADLEFEEAARLRDEIKRLESKELALGGLDALDFAPSTQDKNYTQQAAKANKAGREQQRAQARGVPKKQDSAQRTKQDKAKSTKEEAYNPLEKVVGKIKRRKK